MEQLIYVGVALVVGFVVGILVGRRNAAKFEPYAAKFDEEVARVKKDAQAQIDAAKKAYGQK